jgi:hypothetical protein
MMFHQYARTLFEYQPPEGGPGLTDGQLVELGQEIGITDPEFAETVRKGIYLPWPAFVTERAVVRGVARTPSVFVRGIPVAARPGPILPPSSECSSERFPALSSSSRLRRRNDQCSGGVAVRRPRGRSTAACSRITFRSASTPRWCANRQR